MKAIWIYLAASQLVLTGCAMRELEFPSQDRADGHFAFESNYKTIGQDAPETRLLFQAWRIGTPLPLDGSVGRFRVTVHPAGIEGGCDLYRLSYLDMIHETHYRICNGMPQRATGVACALPRGRGDLERTRASLAMNAWASGRPAASQVDAYVMEALPVGGYDAQGCRVIVARVRCDGFLADWRLDRICGP